MAGVQLSSFSGPQDPSLLFYYLDQIIASLNPVLSGSTPVPQGVSAASTSGNIPSAGALTLNTTTRTATTTGRYSLAAPTAAQVGNLLLLTNISTVKATVKGAFEKSKNSHHPQIHHRRRQPAVRNSDGAIHLGLGHLRLGRSGHQHVT